MKARKQSSGDASLGSGRLLAAIAVLAVAFVVLAAIPAVADDSDAIEGATYYVDGTTTVSDQKGTETAPFATIAQALVKDDVSNIVLKGNVDEYVTISEMVTVTLDLNGFTLTNKNATDSNPSSKGVVVNSGTLTIMDSGKTGTVNATNSKVAIANTGTLTIEGGNFTNTTVEKTNNNGCEYQYVNYLLNNNGTTTIKNGTFIMDERMDGVNSSIIKNGWANPEAQTADKAGNDVVMYKDSRVKTAIMNINGGTYQGPTYVKNDSYGQMTIEDGKFVVTESNKFFNKQGEKIVTPFAANILNCSELSVKGGSFSNTASKNAAGTFWIYYGSETDISGGNFDISNAYGGKAETASPLVVITESEVDTKLVISKNVANSVTGHPMLITDCAIDTDVTVGESSANIVKGDTNTSTYTYTDGKLVINNIAVGEGDSYMSGNIQIESLTVLEDASVNVTKGSTLSVPAGALLSVSSGATFNLSEGAVMNVSKGAAISGSISGSGRIIAQDGADTSGASFGSDIRFGPEYVPMPPTEDDFPGYVPSQTVEKEKKDDSTTQVAIVAAAIAVVLVAIIALLYKSR